MRLQEVERPDKRRKILCIHLFLALMSVSFLFGINRGLGDRFVWVVCLSGHGGVFFGLSPFFLLLHGFLIPFLYIIMLH